MQNQQSSRSKAKSLSLNQTADCSILHLTKKGVRQAVRNHSCSIWSIFSSGDCQCSLKLQFGQASKQLKTYENSEDQARDKEFILSNRSQKAKYQGKDMVIQRDETENNLLIKNQKKVKGQKLIGKQKVSEQNLKQSQQMKKQKRLVVKNYLAKQVPYTRQLSNTAFAKFYNKPCCENYGSRNTKQNQFLYKNYMKTHNLTPHTLTNRPNQYQTHASALKHGKRTKLHIQEKWIKIQRQLAKQLNLNQKKIEKDNENHEAKTKSTQKYNYQQKNTKRTKSEGKIKQQHSQNKDKLSTINTNKQVLFLYRHKDERGSTVTAKDRHGIVCYVDNGFSQNQQAYTNFLKVQSPIYPQKVKNQDKNIDKIRIQNHKQSVQQDLPKHYLMPCVEYDWKKYSFRKKKQEA